MTAPGIHPAIFPTSSIANDVADPTDPTTEDVTTATTYDAWGRVLTVTDPDLVETVTAYKESGAGAATDIATVTVAPAALDLATSYTSDLVGNTETVTNPEGETTTTTYDGLNHVVDVEDPLGTHTRTVYNNWGQATSVIANYLDGTPSGKAGVDDVVTTTTYDESAARSRPTPTTARSRGRSRPARA